MDKHLTREDWLNAGVQALRVKLEEHGNLPDKLEVITSWPYGTKKAIGQCFSKTWTKEETTYICISPALGDTNEILATLLHELIHALVGVDKNHGKPFARVAKKVGLVGKMKATEAGPELKKELDDHLMLLGTYPHAVMHPPAPKVKKKSAKKTTIKFKKKSAKKTTIKFMSPMDPTYTCWLTPAQARKVGPPICPLSKKKMVMADDVDLDGEGEEE